MSRLREQLYGVSSVPTTETTAITAAGNVHIDNASVVNTSGGAITLTVKINGVRVVGGESIADGTTGQAIGVLVNKGFAAGQTLTVEASGAGLEMDIAGRDIV